MLQTKGCNLLNSPELGLRLALEARMETKPRTSLWSAAAGYAIALSLALWIGYLMWATVSSVMKRVPTQVAAGESGSLSPAPRR